MRRYQYLTQAMVELADGRPDAALMTLAPLRPYVQTCARHIDGIHLRVLCAIALFRKRDESWRQELTQALDTAAELQVLRLMCADKSNAEIGQIMDVKLTTVKTHVSHILDKLGVSRRSEAKTAAKKLWLIPEDL